MKKEFTQGMRHGIPIMLGYLSVSFGFGIKAVRAGLNTWEASLTSLTNLTSAGQAAGVEIIAAGGTLLEMALVQLIINIRYSLMALTLSQKLDRGFTLPHRMLAAYGITDEIFALCAARVKPLTPAYMYGMTLSATFGWVLGTTLGAAAGQLLPASLSNAMGILLYGMFLAIIIPPARKERSVLFAVIIAALMSLICKYLLTFISEGFAVIICSVLGAALTAAIFPLPDDAPAKEAR